MCPAICSPIPDENTGIKRACQNAVDATQDDKLSPNLAMSRRTEVPLGTGYFANPPGRIAAGEHEFEHLPDTGASLGIFHYRSRSTIVEVSKRCLVGTPALFNFRLVAPFDIVRQSVGVVFG